MADRYDIAVIGAGVFGSWIAFRFARAGRRVALVDAYGAGNPRATSACRSRVIRMAYGANDVYTRFAHQSLPVWKQLGDDLFVRTGVLWLSLESNDRFQASRATLQSLGIAFEELDSRDLRKRYPQMAAPADAIAILEPDSGALFAHKAVLAVVERARSLGTDVLVEPVRDVDVEAHALVTAAGQRIHAEIFVFACGPWLPKIFPDILDNVITSTRQEIFYFGLFHDSTPFQPPRLPVWLDDTDSRIPYGVPDLDGHGIKIAFHRDGPRFDPDHGDRLVYTEQMEEARQYVAQRFPLLCGAALVDSRVCQYENTPRGDFLIDRHPRFENFWLVGGGSGHGFKHGPAVAEYVLGRIEDRVPAEPCFALGAHTGPQARAVF